MLDGLTSGQILLTTDGQALTVNDALAREFQPGDRLAASAVGGLLRIPQQQAQEVGRAMDAAQAAFVAMEQAKDTQITGFFLGFAQRLADDDCWQRVAKVNAQDVEKARALGRSTTRLTVTDAMRDNMILGLQGWAALPSQRGAVLETVQHPGFRIEQVGAALGVVGFVFEGRPNVLADAAGVLRGGNTAVFRIGRDALATAQCIMQEAAVPALMAAGLPSNAMVLVDSAEHAAGWSLFLDSRLALAIARGSGPAVDLLGSLAQSVGTPVSLHGTGGAWMVASAKAAEPQLQAAVTRSLDRKVCNTLNVCCIPRSAATKLVPAVLAGLEAAAAARHQPYKLHVAPSAQSLVPAELFTQEVMVARADGPSAEAQAQTIAEDQLGQEWEWEDSPEVTLVVVESVAAAAQLFNEHSPRLVASLVSPDASEQEAFWRDVDSPFVGDDHTRWVDGQFALNKPELGLSNWANGRLFGRGAILTGDSIYTLRTRFVSD